jgi:hypothetical protein
VAQTPQEELEQFLAALPSYMQKVLLYDSSMSEHENFDSLHSVSPFAESQLQKLRLTTGWQPETQTFNEDELRPQLERILQRIPAEWKKYQRNAKKARDNFAAWYAPTPRGKPGPKENTELAERIWKLDDDGKTNREIKQVLEAEGQSYSLEAIESYLKTRRRKPKD